MEEIFKDIPGYEGMYQVSNLGRVKSLSREIKRNGFYLSKEKILKPNINGAGYLYVNLIKDKISKSKTIHKLVSEAFSGRKINGFELVVNHKDFNRLNNNLNNLEIVTTRENTNKKHFKSSSNYTGVCWDKHRNKWISSIVINKKQIHLGSFDDELQAFEYYKNALISLNKGEKIITKKRICASKYIGVTFIKKNNKWMSRIFINGNRIYLGHFNTEEEAYNAYQNKLKQI
jgi:hypothetical protein